MYTATMVYPVKDGSMGDFVSIWKEKILDLAVAQKGFVRMQLLQREGEAMAMGTWEDKDAAEAFMALGPFKELMADVEGMLDGDPKPTIWSLAAFESS